MPINTVAKVNSHFQNVNVKNSALVQNFATGDLLYGIEEVRVKFRAVLKEKVGEEEKITIDEYNNKLMYELFSDPFSSEFLANADTAIESLVAERNLNKAEKQYINNSLSYAKLNPQNNEISITNSLEDPMEGTRLRRLCKAALTSPDKKIHFCLDVIDQKQASSMGF